MDSKIISKRLSQLDNILEYVNKTEADVIIALQSVGWSKDRIKLETDLVQCPVDKGHVIPPDKINVHSTQCKLKLQSRDLDMNSRPECFYSREERLTMYDSSVSQSSHCDVYFPLIENNKEHKSDVPRTYLEEMALNRDLKRRRSKYKVSTKSKSYKEVIREVIQNQMGLYEDLMIDKADKLNISTKQSSKLHEKCKKYDDRISKGSRNREYGRLKDEKQSTSNREHKSRKC